MSDSDQPTFKFNPKIEWTFLRDEKKDKGDNTLASE